MDGSGAGAAAIELIQTLQGHTDRVWSVAWSPKGRHLRGRCQHGEAVRAMPACFVHPWGCCHKSQTCACGPLTLAPQGTCWPAAAGTARCASGCARPCPQTQQQQLKQAARLSQAPHKQQPLARTQRPCSRSASPAPVETQTQGQGQGRQQQGKAQPGTAPPFWRTRTPAPSVA